MSHIIHVVSGSFIHVTNDYFSLKKKKKKKKKKNNDHPRYPPSRIRVFSLSLVP